MLVNPARVGTGALAPPSRAQARQLLVAPRTLDSEGPPGLALFETWDSTWQWETWHPVLSTGYWVLRTEFSARFWS